MSTLPQYNPMWMTYNISLAMIPVFLGWFMLETRNKWARVILGFLWFIFLPNSLYLFADITHLFEQWGKVNAPNAILLIIEYSIVMLAGLLTYIYALYPSEKTLNIFNNTRKNTFTTSILVSINFLVGLAVVLGRIQRINSWDIFTDTAKVINAVLTIFSSLDLVTIAILVGLFANFLYFLLRRPVMKYTLQIFKTS